MIDKVALLYLQDGKILTTRSKGKNAWYFPGGKREGEETDLQTLTREIREELSVDILPETAEYAGTFSAQAHGKAEGVTVQMTCYHAAFTGTPRPSSEIEELRWITSADAAIVSPVDRLILAHLKNLGLIE